MLRDYQTTREVQAKVLQDIKVIRGVCRDLLREAVGSKQIDQVTSPAAFLQDLCDRLRFDGAAAQTIHKQIFQSRIQSFLEDKKISGAFQSMQLL